MHEIILYYSDVLDEDKLILPRITRFRSITQYWMRNGIKMRWFVDDAFAYSVSTDIMLSNDIEWHSVDECWCRIDWLNWKLAIQVELDSLTKRKVFGLRNARCLGPVAPTPPYVKPMGYKWVFVRKRNEKNEIMRYKAHLVAQGFSQRPGIDYEETYSPVMDIIMLRYLISLVVSEKIEYTAYRCGNRISLWRSRYEIYMKVPKWLSLTGSSNSRPRNTFSIILRKSLNGLKHSGRMWYNRLSEYLTSQGYVNNELCPCVFIKKSHSRFVIVAVYVNDMNLIGTPA